MFINDVRRGGLVYWDVSGTHTDHHIVEAEVLALNAKTVRCIRRRTYHHGLDGPYTREIPDGYEQPIDMRRSYFDAPLEQRIQEMQEFWCEVAEAFAR